MKKIEICVSAITALSSLHGVEGRFLKPHGGVLAADVTEGEWVNCIFSVHNGKLYACQDEYDGSVCPNKFGKSCSWVLTRELISYAEGSIPVKENEISKRLYDTLMASESIKGKMVSLSFKKPVAWANSQRNNVLFSHTKETFGHHFDVREGAISYCPANQTQTVNNSTGQWARDGRQIIKTGKFIIALMLCDAIEFVVDGRKYSSIPDEIKPDFIAFCELKSGIVKSS